MGKEKDPQGYAPKDVVERLHRNINNSVYGIGYAVKPSAKNSKLREDYIVTDNKIREILLSLTVDDYLKWDYSDNVNYQGEIVHLFQKIVPLIPRYQEDAKERKVSLYIKITWMGKEGLLIVLSIHESGLFD